MPKVKITGLPQMKNGGYTVKKSNARKGKTHVVIGPDGTKKYFGDPKMGEKGKSKHGKKAFYARHAKNLKGNPYFRAYARATWADGGMVDMYEGGGEVTPMYNPAVPEVSVFDLTKQAMGGLIYKLGGPIKAGEGYVQNEPSEGFAYGGYSYKDGSPYATSDSPTPQVTSGLMNYLGYGKPRPYAEGGQTSDSEGYGDPPIQQKLTLTGSSYGTPNIQNKYLADPDFQRYLTNAAGLNYEVGRKGSGLKFQAGLDLASGQGRNAIYNDPTKVSASQINPASVEAGQFNNQLYPIGDIGFKIGSPRVPKGVPTLRNSTGSFGTVIDPKNRNVSGYLGVNPNLTIPIGNNANMMLDYRGRLGLNQMFEKNPNTIYGGPRYTQSDIGGGFNYQGNGWDAGVRGGYDFMRRTPTGEVSIGRKFDDGGIMDGDPPVKKTGTNVSNIDMTDFKINSPNQMQGQVDLKSKLSNTGGFEYIRNQKMTPEEWNKFNESKGYKRVISYSSTGEEMPNYTSYPDYYNPAKYSPGKDIGFGGYRKIEDVNKPSVNYGNDPTYKPFISYDYQAPYVERKPVKTGPTPITPESQGWKQLNEMEYQRNQNEALFGDKSYRDLEYQSVPSGNPNIQTRYMRPKEGSQTWYKSQPGYVPGTKPWETNKQSTIIQAYGGKMPEPILRARLNAHMSPEQVDNYIANYANGGQTGTGILGNMTYNPQPWKYVAGGQLGPYPYPSYKSDLSEFKEGGIHIKPENRGKFTAAADKAGMGVQEYARKVLANKENYSPTLVKRANFARNAAKWHHAYGGYQLPQFGNGGPGRRTQKLLDQTMFVPKTNEQMLAESDMWDAYNNSDVPVTTNTSVPSNVPDQGFWDYAMSQSTLPRDPNSMDIKSLRQRRVDAFVGTPIEYISPDMTSLDDPNFGRTRLQEMDVTDPEVIMDMSGIKKSGKKGSKPSKPGTKSGDKDKQSSDNLYYASQLASQIGPELAYMASQGMRYDKAPRYTDTAEQMSARMPLINYDQAMNAARRDLANRAGSTGSYLSNVAALGAKGALGRAGIREGIDKANLDAREAARKSTLAMRRESDLQEAQNKQAAMNALYGAATSAGSKIATVGKDMRSDTMDKYKWGMLPYITPAMMNDPKFRAYFEKAYGK